MTPDQMALQTRDNLGSLLFPTLALRQTKKPGMPACIARFDTVRESFSAVRVLLWILIALVSVFLIRVTSKAKKLNFPLPSHYRL